MTHNTKIDREKVLAMSIEEWLEWVEPFKRIMPSYPKIAIKAGVHVNTIHNTMRGIRTNTEVRGIILDAIEEAVGEIQQALLS